ncbi:hypothetical protein LTR97_000165 [Elasticomyces elasticus]|uniref:Uncharacterized protein n=1 Tax=Elasticomyces elasticus TaxID=574655 RepID=A0AAN7ZQT1_9PEZI|nr:hypothetical protein LTR97_000165 [Elasticomyces elasticus]
MPPGRLLAQQPPWLARSTPGHTFFHSPSTTTTPPPLAHRGTEIFLSANNELRWTSTSHLQNGKPHRILKHSIPLPITHLSISPSGDLLAISTTHTIHIALLPASSHLHSGDTSPLKLKTHQIGPTDHVLEQSPLASTLWHPLSPTGNCLVTVTRDACVRLWELETNNRSTFSEPSLAIDLKKLANASSSQADFSASKYGVSTGFSPDEVEMLVASSCFGGSGHSNENGWSSMTLWIVMSEGDIYALCPLLPKRWRAPPTLLPGLSTSVVSKLRALSAVDAEVGEREKRTVEQQCKFLAEVDGQEALVLPTTGYDENGYEMMEVYTRPTKPGAVPKLQGPFYMGEEIEAGEVTDIFVVAAKMDGEEDVDDDDDDEYGDEGEEGEGGLSVGVVCLATSSGRVHVCLDLEGVEAEWLPSKRLRSFTPDNDDYGEKSLLLFETIDVSGGGEGNGEVGMRFTASPVDRYGVFVTTGQGVWSLDFSPWTTNLEAELASSSDAGIDFRLRMLLESSRTGVERVVTIQDPVGEASTAIAVFDDEEDSYTILTSSSSNQPYASVLALPVPASHAYAPDNDYDYAAATTTNSLAGTETRAPYEPAQIFYQASALPQLLRTATEKKLLGPGGDKGREVRFSPATLQVMTEAHRIMASETHRLAEGTADLVRRLERMLAELREQVRRVREVGGKVEDVVGGTEGGVDGEGMTGRAGIEARAQKAEDRTKRLGERVEKLRGRMSELGGRQLSVKEKAFAAEVERVEKTLGNAPTPEAPVNPSALVHMENSEVERREHEEGRDGTLTGRFEAVRELRDQLVAQVEESVAEQSAAEEGKGGGRGVVGGGFRGRRLEAVWELLEREGALVEGMEGRLARLGAGT